MSFDAVKSLQGMMDERRLDQWTIQEVNGVKIDLLREDGATYKCKGGLTHLAWAFERPDGFKTGNRILHHNHIWDTALKTLVELETFQHMLPITRLELLMRTD